MTKKAVKKPVRKTSVSKKKSGVSGELKLTAKQRRFCEEYLKDFNGAAAARRAGYSENTCYEIASENLIKPNIKQYISQHLDRLSMEAGEVAMRFTNMSRGNMSDYMVKRLVPHTPQIKVGLEVVIKRLQNEFDFEDDFALKVNYQDKELAKHMEGQEYRRRKLIRYKMELERNPNAFRIIDGETIMVEQAELDLVKIMEDKERGVIKSFKYTKDGPQVELYSADAALAQMAKIRGMMVDKSEVDVTSKGESIVEKPDFSKLSKEEKLQLLELHKKVKGK